MSGRRADGSAGDADYGRIGGQYARYRRPDPRIGRRIRQALGPARTVLNVGAGAGGYEPTDRIVTAVEPSATMRAQRPRQLPPSVHQWSDTRAGLSEMRRVSAGPVVILTCDPALVTRFWLADYAPEVLAAEARRYPAPSEIAQALGGPTTVTTIPIPLDCTDGFNEAYFGRPEMLLDPAARRSYSAWSFVTPGQDGEYTDALRRALESGRWDAAHGGLRSTPFYDGSLILVTNTPEP